MTSAKRYTGPVQKQGRPRKTPRPDLPDAREDCARRARWLCEVAGLVPHECPGRGTEAHHRRMRSQGGSDDMDNLLWVCGPAHRWIHANPEQSYRAGWLVRGLGRSSALLGLRVDV